MSDPYWELAAEQRDNIFKLYEMFDDKHPVMLFDIQEQRIYAYPYEDFKADLNKSSQNILQSQYEQAMEDGEIVVFVRDNEKEKLVSFPM